MTALSDSRTRTSRQSYLPNEIWVQIVETWTDRQTAKNLRLVSRQLCQNATPTVFREISTAIEKQSLGHFINISNSEALSPHVNYINLHIRDLPNLGDFSNWRTSLILRETSPTQETQETWRRVYEVYDEAECYCLYEQYEEDRKLASAIITYLKQDSLQASHDQSLFHSLKMMPQKLRNIRRFSAMTYENQSIRSQWRGYMLPLQRPLEPDEYKDPRGAMEISIMLYLLARWSPLPPNLDNLELNTRGRAFWSESALSSLWQADPSAEPAANQLLGAVRETLCLAFTHLSKLRLEMWADTETTDMQEVASSVGAFLKRSAHLRHLDLMLAPPPSETWGATVDALGLVQSQLGDRQWALKHLSLKLSATEQSLVRFIHRHASNVQYLVLDSILLDGATGSWPSTLCKLRPTLSQVSRVAMGRLECGERRDVMLDSGVLMQNEIWQLYRLDGDVNRPGFYVDAYEHYENDVMDYLLGDTDEKPQHWLQNDYFAAHPKDCEWCEREAWKLPRRRELAERCGAACAIPLTRE